ncbi:hypothetical protein GA0115246_114581, partial [Streptomyces sp. SolWspMP-sol7th]
MRRSGAVAGPGSRRRYAATYGWTRPSGPSATGGGSVAARCVRASSASWSLHATRSARSGSAYAVYSAFPAVSTSSCARQNEARTRRVPSSGARRSSPGSVTSGRGLCPALSRRG